MKVAFSDFYGGYEQDLSCNPVTSYFVNSPKFTIVQPWQDPDLIVCSTWGNKHTKYNDVPKIMWTAENLVAGQPWPGYTFWDGVDWTISNNHRESIIDLPSNIRHYYVPYAGIHHDMDKIKTLHDKNYNKPKTKFCCFVSRAQGAAEGYKLRYDFFNLINDDYRHVDSAGPTQNNVGYTAPRGDAYFDWVSDYKFMICFENSQGAGYITEKIFTPYAGATIPIYWGDKSNFDLVRKEACLLYTTPQETLAKLIMLDRNPEMYENLRKESLFYPEVEGKDDILNQKYLRKVYDQIIAEIKS